MTGVSMSSSRRKAQRLPEAAAAITPERWRKGDVERLPQAIADEAGRPSRPYRAVDTLGVMLRKGTISPAMRQAGDDFHALFLTASLDPLRAADWRSIPQGFSELSPTLRQVGARDKVWKALQALGGIASPAGSCVWHVVGCAWSIKEWSLREGWGGRPLSQETAAGILVGALGVLQGHFGI